MKGVIFNVVEEVVVDLHGPAAWDAVLADANLDGAYTALGNYDDADLGAIVASGAKALGVSEPDLMRVVGEHGLAHLVRRLPTALDDVADARSFLRKVNEVIHPEVLKLYPQAIPPIFEFEDDGDDLLVTYRSRRNLAPLAEGLISGCTHLFDEAVDVTVVDDSAEDATVFRVAFSAAGLAAA